MLNASWRVSGRRHRRWVLVPLAALILGSLPYAGARAEDHVVIVESMQFSPARLEVKQGDTVTWTNRDFFPHTATSRSGEFDSGNIGNGQSWSFKAMKKGAYPYVCTLHPGMKAELVVK